MWLLMLLHRCLLFCVHAYLHRHLSKSMKDADFISSFNCPNSFRYITLNTDHTTFLWCSSSKHHWSYSMQHEHCSEWGQLKFWMCAIAAFLLPNELRPDCIGNQLPLLYWWFPSVCQYGLHIKKTEGVILFKLQTHVHINKAIRPYNL